ncbi:MAG TPA: hypothetical protein GXZ20_07565 [Halanaerobiaceae bacterium]|jgi:hypothetical protein|nr:hypothetical protein [Bacillota bacterium]HHU92972.1 hypothetical protein [Halanaerobiaceae bacterium]HOA41549.1 hypothetical protein [Halanaerobiales bacterium]HPZ63660.1 hypothetical protein [Halanaerobiales bacterium]HQD04912.1 hypothetical protein [Halanaerobiales bacterium]
MLVELCSLCQRIKEIRIRQEKVYYYELCEECKRKEITYVIRKMRKRINSI